MGVTRFNFSQAASTESTASMSAKLVSQARHISRGPLLGGPPACALLLLFGLAMPHARAADWLAVNTELGDVVAFKDKPYRHAWLDAAPLRGRWVRIAGNVTDATAPNLFMVHVYRHQQRIAYAPVSLCNQPAGPARCAGATWVAPEATRVMVGVYVERPTATVRAVRVEASAEALPPQTEAGRRLGSLIDTMADRYWKTSQVDWARLRRDTQPMLQAPADIDPVPAAVSRIVQQLPENKHTALRRRPSSDGPPLAITERPHCRAVSYGVWLLTMPTAGMPLQRYSEYVEAAHACLLAQPVGTRWIIDFRAHAGGNSHATIEALAPLLPAGPLLTWVGAKGQRTQVMMTPAGLVTGDARLEVLPPVPSMARAIGARTGSSVLAWIGPGCASACEAAVVAISSRPDVRVVGLPTAGLTSSNDTVEVSPQYTLFLTADVMETTSGTPVAERVEPQSLSDSDDSEAMARLF